MSSPLTPASSPPVVPLKIAAAQVNPTLGDLSANTSQILAAVEKARQSGANVVVTPELALCGSPPQDLLLRPDFLAACEQALNGLGEKIETFADITLIVGHPAYMDGARYNSATVLQPGHAPAVYRKMLLSEAFDEQRYFSQGSTPLVVDIGGVACGLAIGEDICQEHPARLARAAGADLLLVLAAAPYHLGKPCERLQSLASRVRENDFPALYVNLVGGQDELVFDGGSFALERTGKMAARLPRFQESLLLVEYQTGDLCAALRHSYTMSAIFQGNHIDSNLMPNLDHEVRQSSTLEGVVAKDREGENCCATTDQALPFKGVLRTAIEHRNVDSMLRNSRSREDWVGMGYQKSEIRSQVSGGFLIPEPHPHPHPSLPLEGEGVVLCQQYGVSHMLRVQCDAHSRWHGVNPPLQGEGLGGDGAKVKGRWLLRQALEGEGDSAIPSYSQSGWCFASALMRLPCNIAPDLSVEEEVWQALTLGIRDYVKKNRFPGVLLGFSGGIDSALVLALAVDALGKERVRTVMMPSPYTAQMSLDDARTMTETLGTRHDEIGIEPIMRTFQSLLAPHFSGLSADTTEENIQARGRGMILMALSNKTGELVLTAGNKSEMAVGYCTLYGDMVGGLAVLKDIPKTLVYRLARYRNRLEPGNPPIPENIINRPPSAELKPGQTDQDTLPPYEILDAIIEGYMEKNKSAAELINDGLPKECVAQVIRLFHLAEYKRSQASVGILVTPRGFGKNWRYPITNRWSSP